MSQNRRSLSRRTGGRPGDRIAGRPVTVVIHPAGRPIRTSTIKVLRRPVESAQYLSIRYTDRLSELGITGSVGSRGDSFDNALAETVNGLFKAELIKRRGPWRSVEQVELATLDGSTGGTNAASTPPWAVGVQPNTRPSTININKSRRESVPHTLAFTKPRAVHLDLDELRPHVPAAKTHRHCITHRCSPAHEDATRAVMCVTLASAVGPSCGLDRHHPRTSGATRPRGCQAGGLGVEPANAHQTTC
jgi:hypothetical protein